MVTRTSAGRDVSRGAAQGAADGTFFLTFFGAYWGFFSAVFLSGTVQVISFFLVGLVTLAFLGRGVMLLRQALALPKEPSREDGARGRRIARGFGIIFGLEIVLIALASILLSIFPLSRFIAPTTALIVGLHFIPLARLFQVNVGYVTGADRTGSPAGWHASRWLLTLPLVPVCGYRGHTRALGDRSFHDPIWMEEHEPSNGTKGMSDEEK